MPLVLRWLLRIEPAISSLTLSPGDEVMLKIDVYGLQDVLDNTLADTDNASHRPRFEWTDGSAGGTFSEARRGDGVDRREVLYIGAMNPGSYTITVNVPHVSGCVGPLGDEDAEQALARCTATFDLKIRRPSISPEESESPVNPSGPIPLVLTDSEGVAYAVLTPEDGGVFTGEGFSFTAHPGGVGNNEFIGISMYHAGPASNVGQTHHRYSLAGDWYRVDVVNQSATRAASYRLSNYAEVCLPLPAELRSDLSDLALLAYQSDGFTVLSSRVVLRAGSDIELCGALSSLLAQVAAGRRGAPDALAPVSVLEPDGVPPDTGGYAPTATALLAMLLAGGLVLGSSIAVLTLWRRRLRSK